jgi:hypothetical protein
MPNKGKGKIEKGFVPPEQPRKPGPDERAGYAPPESPREPPKEPPKEARPEK